MTTSELKKKLEAILFSAGKKVSYEECARLTNSDIGSVKAALKELKKDYDERDTSLLLSEESDGWKLTIQELYLPVVEKLLPETELPRSVIETLAVIAWRQPVLQSEVVDIRSNKAYEHISELQKMGFITKEPKGRSYTLKTTKKFDEYFDLPGKEAVRKIFRHIQEQAKQNVEVVSIPKEDKNDEGGEKVFRGEHLGPLKVYKTSGEEEQMMPTEEDNSEETEENEENFFTEEERKTDEYKSEKGEDKTPMPVDELSKRLEEINKAPDEEIDKEADTEDDNVSEESSKKDGDNKQSDNKEEPDERTLDPRLEKFIAENSDDENNKHDEDYKTDKGVETSDVEATENNK